MKRTAAAFCTACFALVISGVASAALFRAYVSSTGNDANDCTLPHPCRLLPKALTTILGGGEIWMLDSANYNTAQVNIDRSVTILAIPGALGSVVATGGGDAIFIGTAGIKVTLRNLVIVRLGSGSDGIGVNAAAEVDIEDCEISSMTTSGIAAYDASAKVRVASTRLRGNNSGVYARGAVVVNLDHVTSVGNATAGVFADSGSTVIVSNSILRNNVNGAYATDSHLSLQSTQSDSNATAGLYAEHRAVATAHDSSFASNGSYGVLASSVAGEITEVILEHSSASGSGVGFRVAASGGTGQSLMFANGNECLNCFYMFEFAGGGGIEAIVSAGNNSPVGSGLVNNGALTPPFQAPFI